MKNTPKKNEKGFIDKIKDIFVKPETNQQEIAPLNLQLIINKSVLINNKWYKVGEDVEGYKIINIRQDYVIVDQYGDRVKLKIQTNNPKIRLKTSKKRVK